jgi:hypothetical protein
MRRDPKPSGRRRSARSGLVDTDVVVDRGSVVSDDELTEDVADSVVVVDAPEDDGPDEQAATTPTTTTSPSKRRTATSCRVARR